MTLSLASRSEFFRKIFENENSLEEYDVSAIFADEKSMKSFTFYIYHNFLEKPSCPFEMISEQHELEDDAIDDEMEEDCESPIHEKSYTNEADAKIIGVEISTTERSGNSELKSIDKSEDQSISEESYSLGGVFNLYKAADHLGTIELCQLCEYLVGQQTTMENALEILDFAIENGSIEAFSAAELFILSCGNLSFIYENFSGEELNYFIELQGPITFDNVIRKLEYVMKIINSNSSLDLNDVYKERLSHFHKPKLVWFIVRNISQISMEFLQKLQGIQYSYVVEKSLEGNDQTCQKTVTTNLLSIVQYLADRYGYIC